MYDQTNKDYVGVPDDFLQDMNGRGGLNHQEAMEKKTEGQAQEDGDRAKHHKDF